MQLVVHSATPPRNDCTNRLQERGNNKRWLRESQLVVCRILCKKLLWRHTITVTCPATPKRLSNRPLAGLALRAGRFSLPSRDLEIRVHEVCVRVRIPSPEHLQILPIRETCPQWLRPRRCRRVRGLLLSLCALREPPTFPAGVTDLRENIPLSLRLPSPS